MVEFGPIGVHGILLRGAPLRYWGPCVFAGAPVPRNDQWGPTCIKANIKSSFVTKPILMPVSLVITVYHPQGWIPACTLGGGYIMGKLCFLFALSWKLSRLCR